VIGVILLTLLPTLFQFLDTYKTMASGFLLVAALLYFPSGLYGGFTSLIRRLSGSRRSVSPT
jgi:ABC-type branched-subunit amino acid transport system permease subunit